jgi:hypothetical protein
MTQSDKNGTFNLFPPDIFLSDEMVDLKKADAREIIIELVVYSVSLYLALAVGDALRKTVARHFKREDEVEAAWTSLLIAVVITGIVIFGIVKFGGIRKDSTK